MEIELLNNTITKSKTAITLDIKNKEHSSKKKLWLVKLSSAVISTAMLICGGAFAQESIESQLPEKRMIEVIVVTAEKRSENASNIPIAITTFSGESIERAGVTGVKGLSQLSSSIQVGHQDVNTFVSIRGIGSDLINIGGESGVTISQNGIPLVNQVLFDADFFDAVRVEILRGPQGTISGRNATGGAINIHSRRPSAEFEYGIKAKVGNYQRYGLEGYVGGQLSDDRIMARLSVRTEKADGWLKNTYRNTYLNSTDKSQARLSLLANINNNLDAYLVLETLDDRSAPVSTVDLGRARTDKPGYAESYGVPSFDPKRLEFQADFANKSHVEKYSGVLTFNWQLGSTTNLSSTSGYITFDRTGKDDFDATIIEGSSFDCTCLDLWQASQELTLTANITDHLDLIIGAMYMKSEAHEPLDFGLPIFGLPERSIQLKAEQSLTSYAVYSQWRYRWSDDLRISLGARYTKDSKNYFEENFFFGYSAGIKTGDESWKAFTPRMAIDYSMSEDIALYGSISRGFKAGGFNTFSSEINKFAPEYVLNYEMGAKVNSADKGLKAAVAVFYMDYVDLQQTLWILEPATGLALPSVKNAANATITGAEMELVWLASDQLEVSISGTWLEATYDKLLSIDVLYPELGERNFSDNHLVRAPEWQFNVGAEYRKPLAGEWQIILRADYGWQDKVYYDYFNNDSVSQDSYGLLNFTASIETMDARWQFSMYAHNTHDELYINNIHVVDGAPQQLSGNPGSPRTYGMSVAYHF